MKRQVALAVTILLIVNLLGPNAASAQTVVPSTQGQSPNGATDLSIQGTASARTLYVTNFSGNVGVFTLDQAGIPALLEVVGNVGTVLRSIAIAPNGRTTFVLDSGDAATITAFAIDQQGRLTRIGKPVQTDPKAQGPFGACGPGGTVRRACPQSLAVAPNGRHLYVVNAGSNTISIFHIHPNGKLSLVGNPISQAPPGTIGIAISPDGRRLYVTRLDDTIGIFAINENGQLKPFGQPVQLPGCTPSGTPPQPQCAPNWASITPNGQWLYTSNPFSGDVSTFAIRPDGGLTAVGERVPVGGIPETVSIKPDGRFLYVGVNEANALRAFAIGADGQLQFLGSAPTCEEFQIPFACGAPASAAAPSGASVYAVNTFRSPNENDLVAFSIQPDGSLVNLAAVPSGGDRPLYGSIAIRPNQGPSAILAPTSGVVNQEIMFDASSSSDADGEVVRYDWDFGDGQTAADAGPHPVHVYTDAGNYHVTVIVTDNEGCSGTFIFTGQTALCNGSFAATATQMVVVN
jgi:6-phosphogluconolactonase (cycloisomerase 2 family)